MVVNRSREAWKTYGNVFDNFTIRNLQKLMGSGYFEELTTSIALGKEANVFGGETKDGSMVAVKIYRLENCNFNKMYEYISQDPRYLDLKGQRRKIIFAWTQREYRNLLKAREVIRVPTPLTFKHNIIVMEYVTDGTAAAPQLKDVNFEEFETVFDQIIVMMKKLFEVGLVHGDLSEFNILIEGNDPVFIDFSQSTAVEAQNASELLKRDVTVLCRFFKKRGVERDVQTIYDSIVKKTP
jgi:RIO kinase 1